MSANDGWGRMLPDRELGIAGGVNDQSVGRFWEAVAGEEASTLALRNRLPAERVRIYQLLPRLFGNVNETRTPNGDIRTNGVGKFSDINDAALAALRELGFTHLWLTGVLQQATATAHPEIDQPADDPDLLKGLAGSPYAIRDCFDVCADYATNSGKRLEEFQALLQRIHRHGLQAIIDLVPNHVARSYASKVRPECDFGLHDDRGRFFSPANHFYYLQPEDVGHGPPLLLPTVRDGCAVSPTCLVVEGCDGRFGGETDYGRVTGNNVVSWAPQITDWYETVKLNYGYDFTTGRRLYPHAAQPHLPVPSTWDRMDQILAYWQEIGVDGFRCDMAHMIPPEFWSWAIGRARARNPQVWFMAEAYDDDPAKVPSGDPMMNALAYGRGNILLDLLNAGFDAAYDHPTYRKLKSVYDSAGWANDLDDGLPHDFVLHHTLRYAENHDEVRLAATGHWSNAGPRVGRPVSAILFGTTRGPIMIYHGQEVGEGGSGDAGFCRDEARTTIFDYWSMPEFAKWVNHHRYDGGRLSDEQRDLRAFYGRLLRLIAEPAFRDGECFPLNRENNGNAKFGRLPGEAASGHWLYAFLRCDPRSRQCFLSVSNLHPKETLWGVNIRLSSGALSRLSECAGSATRLRLKERLSSADAESDLSLDSSRIASEGISIDKIAPLTPLFYEITSE